MKKDKKKATGCYLYGTVDHASVPDKYLPLVVAGRLFDARPLCGWCYLHLRDMCKPILTDADFFELQRRRERYPQYARIADQLTDVAKVELLHRQVIELAPSDLPRRFEQVEGYPKNEVLVNPRGKWLKEENNE